MIAAPAPAGPLGAIHVTGTLVNAATVLVGTAIGTLLGDRLPERIRETVMHGLGLFVLALGVVESMQAFSGPLARFTRGAPWSSSAASWWAG